MADTMTKKKRSDLMSRIRSSRTKPEMLFHGILKGNRVPHQMWPNLPGHPDCVIFKDGTGWPGGTCVFVHGCFWHRCPKHYREPKSNTAFWRNKVARNVVRHERAKRELRRAGYNVVTVWEHDVRGGADKIINKSKK